MSSYHAPCGTPIEIVITSRLLLKRPAELSDKTVALASSFYMTLDSGIDQFAAAVVEFTSTPFRRG
jgi:hypothetical protein